MEFSRNLPKVCNFHDQNHQKYKDNFGLTEKIVIFLIFFKEQNFYFILLPSTVSLTNNNRTKLVSSRTKETDRGNGYVFSITRLSWPPEVFQCSSYFPSSAVTITIILTIFCFSMLVTPCEADMAEAGRVTAGTESSPPENISLQWTFNFHPNAALAAVLKDESFPMLICSRIT